jgi:choice-of-anchor A domain-containing protein/uncharacterized repeat protein (TIGR01451 family)
VPRLEALEDRTVFATSLGTALHYNALIFGSLANVNGGDTEGRLAVRGDANLTSWGVGNLLSPDSTRDDLIVGGDLSYTNGQVFSGNVVYGGTASLVGVGIPNGTARQQSSIFLNPATGNAVTTGGQSFAQLQEELVNKSEFWASLPNSGTVTLSFSNLTLTGTDPTLDVFNVTAAQWNAITNGSVTISAPAGATVLVNIAGENPAWMNTGMSLSGGTNQNHVLLNFFEAKTITSTNFSYEGSVLAPLAAATLDRFTNGNVEGTGIFGANVNTTSFEFHNFPFLGMLPDVTPPTPTPEADLRVIKTVIPTTTTVGNVVTFTVALTNLGPDDATNVTVMDTLDSGLQFVSATPPAGTTFANGVWTVPAIANGVTLDLTISALTVATGFHSNFAAVTHSDQEDPDDSNNQDEASVDVLPPAPAADLEVTKEVTTNPTPNVGDLVTFTVGLTNHGPDDATNVVVGDMLPEGLTFVSAAPSQGGYDSATGLWTVGDVPNNATQTLQITVRVTESGPQTNLAFVEHSDQFDPNPDNDRAEAEVDAPPAADLSVEKVVNDTTPDVGDTVIFMVVVTNHGPDDATNVVVGDRLPAGLTFLSSLVSQGSYDPAAGVWTVGDIPTLRAAILLFRVQVASPDVHTNVAAISHSDQFDPDPSNNRDSATITPERADIALTKVVQPSQVMFGQNVNFTLIVHNKGPNTATDVFVDDPLPPGLVFVSATPSQGTFAPVSGVWIVGTLLNGATATLELTARVAAIGPIVNLAEAGADQFDPNLSNNVATVTVTGANPASIISKRSFLASAARDPAPAAGPARPLPALNALRADIAFINGLYEASRRRKAKPGELAFCMTQLLLGLPRSAVARRL